MSKANLTSQQVSIYRLLLTSDIPVYKTQKGFVTLDLWARDLEGQCDVIGPSTLVCPIIDLLPQRDDLTLVPIGITVLNAKGFTDPNMIQELIKNFDVVQVPGSKTRWAAGLALNFTHAAQVVQRCLILGISSNRAKTTLINAQNQGFIIKTKAFIKAWSIGRTQRYLASKATGVLLVGEGLREALKLPVVNTHVGTASWIRREELISQNELEKKYAKTLKRDRIKLCIATRLERMKGVHIAIEAMAVLRNKLGSTTPLLTIFGEGPEKLISWR